MKITHKKTKAGTVLILDGELTIYTIAQAKKELLHDYEKLQSPINLDLHGVSEIDTAGIQLLLFAHKLFNDIQKKLCIEKSNEHVDNVLSSLDVVTHFNPGN
jgi:anti-anti-sigma factor